MKKLTKKFMPFVLSAALVGSSFVAPITAYADNSKVVTLGADLSDEQKAEMYNYFGTDKDAVVTIDVTNADERQYLEGVATEDQIGTRTLSCAYVEPTSDGGINVKVANLTFVTSSMIASTLLTSGVENCNVVAACPIEVSGTGALTGIMMAYEAATGEELNEEQKATATEELVVTGDIAEDVGDEAAADIMNEVKEDVIKGNVSSEEEIRDLIKKVAEKNGVDLTDEQITSIVNVMINISNFSYNTNAFTKTLNNLSGGASNLANVGFIQGVINTLNNVISGATDAESTDAGILSETKDELLGEDATINSTVDGDSEDGDSPFGGFFDKILGFVKEKVSAVISGGDEDASESDFSEGASDNADFSADSSDFSTTWDFDDTLDEDESTTDDESADDGVDDTTDEEAEEVEE